MTCMRCKARAGRAPWAFGFSQVFHIKNDRARHIADCQIANQAPVSRVNHFTAFVLERDLWIFLRVQEICRAEVRIVFFIPRVNTGGFDFNVDLGLATCSSSLLRVIPSCVRRIWRGRAPCAPLTERRNVRNRGRSQTPAFIARGRF